jgi:fructokinase
MKIICFGEILFDIYKNKKILAGAPLNVASICSALNIKTSIISSINSKDYNYIIKELKNRNILPLCNSSKFKTVEAKIKLQNSVPKFQIDSFGSFDNISFNNYKKIKNFDLLYFGTLSQRSKKSRDCLRNIIKNCNIKTVYDVNLRDCIKNWENIVTENYKIANIIKLNIDELNVINKLGINLLKDAFKFKCKYIILTKGKKGAELYSKKGKLFSITPNKIKVKDTTGCGDAFLSGFLYGIKKDIKTGMRIGNKCASIVAKSKGSFSENIKKEIRYKNLTNLNSFN